MSDFPLESLTFMNLEPQIFNFHNEFDVYKFSNLINSLISRCISTQDPDFLLKTLEILSKLQFSSSNDYLYIHFFEAFQFLLTTSNVKKCIEVYSLYLARKQHPCEKSFNKIMEFSIKEGLFDEISELLDELLALNKLSSNALKEIFDNLKISNRCDFASKLILEIPLENPSICYIWDFYIENFCKGNERIIKNTLKILAKLNVPEKTEKIQAIYGILLDFLMKNNEESDFIFEVLFDIIELDLKVSGQNIRAFWLKCFEENFEFSKLFENLKKSVNLLDSYSIGLILKKLIQGNRKFETLRFLDYFINGNFNNIKFADINLSANEFKYLIILQNQLNNFKEKKIKEGDIMSEADIVEKEDFSILDSFSFENFDGK